MYESEKNQLGLETKGRCLVWKIEEKNSHIIDDDLLLLFLVVC
jgi:hypothetical protein